MSSNVNGLPCYFIGGHMNEVDYSRQCKAFSVGKMQDGILEKINPSLWRSEYFQRVTLLHVTC